MTKKSGLRLALIAGIVAVGLVLACVVGWIIFASVGRSAYDADLGGSRLLSLPGAPPQAKEVVVERVAVEAAPEEPSADMSYNAAGLAYAAERLIIRTGNISMVVEDTRAAQGAIEQMVERMAGEGAFIVSSDEAGGTEGSQPYITMSIRVPATRFDQTMDRLAELAVEVTNRSESAQDVTEEYVDLEARLESLEAARKRLLDIMAEARTTKDLLEAEQQLTQRESEIESIKGRMQYLEESAQLSSIWVELQPYILSQPVGEQWRPAETARRAVDTLLDGLRGFADFLIVFAIAVLPWLVALGLIALLVVALARWRIRVRRARSAAAGSEVPERTSGSA
jgi:hypothetical protein